MLRRVVVFVVLGLIACGKGDKGGGGGGGGGGARKPADVDVEGLAKASLGPLKVLDVAKKEKEVSLTYHGEIDGLEVKGFVRAGHCDAHSCAPMDEAFYKKDQEAAKQSRAQTGYTAENSVYEVTFVDLAGRRTLLVYKAAYLSTPPSTATENTIEFQSHGPWGFITGMVSGKHPEATSFAEYKDKLGGRGKLDKTVETIFAALSPKLPPP